LFVLFFYFTFYCRKSFPFFFPSLIFMDKESILQKLPPGKQNPLPYLAVGTDRDYYFRMKERQARHFLGWEINIS